MFVGKKNKRRKQRSTYDEVSIDVEPSLPAKRVSTYRKQASLPASGVSDDARQVSLSTLAIIAAVFLPKR